MGDESSYTYTNEEPQEKFFTFFVTAKQLTPTSGEDIIKVEECVFNDDSDLKVDFQIGEVTPTGTIATTPQEQNRPVKRQPSSKI